MLKKLKKQPEIPLENIGLGTGWYGAEPPDGETFRWTRRVFSVIPSGNISEDGVLSLTVYNNFPDYEVSLTVRNSDGAEIDFFHLLNAREKYDIKVGKSELESQLVFELSKALTDDFKDSDPRELGVRVYDIKLMPGEISEGKDENLILNFRGPYENIYYGPGWYNFEISDKKPFRWTRQVFSLLLRGNASEDSMLSLTILSDYETELTVRDKDGREINYFFLRHRRNVCNIKLGPGNFPGQLFFELSEELPDGLIENESRELGVRVIDISLSTSDFSKAAGDEHSVWKAKGPPLFITVETTNRCNFKCLMCVKNSIWQEPSRDFSEDNLEKISSTLCKAETVFLHGVGEPLLSPTFKKTIRLLPEDKPRANFNTNGSLLTDELLDLFMSGKVKEINVSLDAARKDTYKLIRNYDFEKVCNNIRKIVSRRNAEGKVHPEVWINMTLMQLNIEEASAFVDLASELGVNGIYFWHLNDDSKHDWTVERNGVVFNYKEQMLNRDPERSNLFINGALKRGKELAIEIKTDLNKDFIFE
jgi:organic radical activating enzyme